MTDLCFAFYSLLRPSTGTESAPPRPLAGESAPSSPKQAEAPQHQGQEGAPEPPRSGVEADPITISGGSGGDGSSMVEAAKLGGGETRTWKTVDDDGRFPSLVDLFLRHAGSLETVEELIRGVKARANQEIENWCPDRSV